MFDKNIRMIYLLIRTFFQKMRINTFSSRIVFKNLRVFLLNRRIRDIILRIFDLF